MSSTNRAHDLPEQDDPDLLRAVQDYMQKLEAGQMPDRAQFLATVPQLAAALGPYLDALEMVQAAAPLLQSSVTGRTHAVAAEATGAEPLGDFRILREIGRGGMGIVYEATQLSLGRRVALKVLPFAAALDARQLRRFKNEAQAAAQLHHTNIVPVHYVGCERGVHFYAMQLIEGQNLASLIDEMRPRTDDGVSRIQSARKSAESTGPYGSAPSSPALPSVNPPSTMAAQMTTQRSARIGDFFRTAARLAARAAEALDYAHGMGVVHRDIKPANLLLDGNGAIWITDFGLAQFQADAGITQSGDLLGTLRYMSPEQASGQRVLVDHRTDVYSLGATLYELLTFRPLFDGSGRQALLRQILEEEPKPPRALDPNIPPELETIVLKSLGKAPTERYATAKEFADDLQRFLEDRPIRARRPSLREKGTKWARRHRGIVGSALAALVLLVAGLSVATFLTARAYDRERAKATEAAEQRAMAEESFRQARRAVEQFVQIGEEEMAGNPATEGMRRQLLQTALSYYQDFIDQRRDDPSTQLELEASRAHVETILAELTTLMGMGRYLLLQQKPVQVELGLSAEQRQALARLEERMRTAFREGGWAAPANRERGRLALAREQELEVSQLLTAEQHKRFTQIALQAQGPGAFREPEVAAAMKLTAEQRERLRALEIFAFFPRGERFRPGPPPTSGGKSQEAPSKPMAERIRNILTEEQARKWRELTGEPFDCPFPMLLPGPPVRPFGPSGGQHGPRGEEHQP